MFLIEKLCMSEIINVYGNSSGGSEVTETADSAVSVDSAVPG